MLDFSDKPYRWFPPRRSALITGLVGLYNRKFRLPKYKRVMAVRVTGDEKLRAALRPGDRLLFLPNHPSHADPETAMEALRQAEQTTLVMAAYDVFLRNRFNGWLMQKAGAFSVDREGSDAKALKVAKETLVDGKHGLTIFPEGNVYLQNDIVTPFHDGAAMIGLRTARELAEKNVRIIAAPIALKYTHMTDAREPVLKVLRGLAEMVGVKPAGSESPVDLLKRVGIAALQRNLKHRGVDVPAAAELPALIESAATSVLARLEAKIGQKTSPGDTPIDRVRKARRTIHQIRLDPQRAADHAAAIAWADEAMVAFKIVSYSGNYVASSPTLDRFAETVEKLEEDIHSKMPAPMGPREAFVRFSEPIDVTPRIAAFEEKARAAVAELTQDIERAVQAGVDGLNTENRNPGVAVRMA